MRMTRGALCLGLALLAAACSSSEPTTGPTAPGLPFTAARRAGSRADAHRDRRLPPRFDCDGPPGAQPACRVRPGNSRSPQPKTSRAISGSSLAAYDVIAFVLTSGELDFSSAQKTAITDFVSSGKGFIGIHSASDTLYEWPDYGRLVGAYFKEHPWTQSAGVIVENTTHPATSGLGERFSLLEEFYTFRDNPRGRVQVLLKLDPISVGAAGDYPLAWAQSFGSGRAYYNALGHFSETWTDQRFQRQLLGAIRWTGETRLRSHMVTRRAFIGAATAALAAGSAAAGQQAATPPRVKGPLVWLNMDQKELDDAYDQSVWAPNQQQVQGRFASNSELDATANRCAQTVRLRSNAHRRAGRLHDSSAKRADQHLHSRRRLARGTREELRASPPRCS